MVNTAASSVSSVAALAMVVLLVASLVGPVVATLPNHHACAGAIELNLPPKVTATRQSVFDLITVHFHGEGGDHVNASSPVSADGTFILADLRTKPRGVITVAAPAHWDFHPTKIHFDGTKGLVCAGATNPLPTLQFVLAGLKDIKGRVVVDESCSDAGTPMKNVTVRLGANVEAVTDSDGFYVIPAVGFGPQQVTVTRTIPLEMDEVFPAFDVPEHAKEDVVPARMIFRAPTWFYAEPVADVPSMQIFGTGASVVVPFHREDKDGKSVSYNRVFMTLRQSETGKSVRALKMRNDIVLFQPVPCGDYVVTAKDAGDLPIEPKEEALEVVGAVPTISPTVFRGTQGPSDL